MNKPQELTDADRAEQVAAILSTVTIESGPPRGGVDEDDKTHRWPHVAFSVTLKRNGRAFFIGPYRFGVGHFKPTAAEAARIGSFTSGLPAKAGNMAAAMAKKPYADFINKELVAAVAAHIAKARKFSPSVVNVLPAILSDGSAYFDAETFDDWCGNFGYDSDSINARDTFDACDKIGRGIARAFTPAEIEALRDWTNEQ